MSVKEVLYCIMNVMIYLWKHLFHLYMGPERVIFLKNKGNAKKKKKEGKSHHYLIDTWGFDKAYQFFRLVILIRNWQMELAYFQLLQICMEKHQ